MAVATLVISGCLYLRLLAPTSPWRGVAWPLVLAGLLTAQGALYRVALRGDRATGKGLVWTAVEPRLIAVWILTFVFLGILSLLAFVVILSLAYGVASAGTGFVASQPGTWARAVDDRGRVVLGLVGGLVLVGMTWASTRVSLAGAATVAKGKIQVLASWSETRGRVWSIAFARAVLMAFAVAGALLIVLLWGRFGRDVPGALWASDMAVSFVIVGLWLPANVGLMSYLYQRAPSP